MTHCPQCQSDRITTKNYAKKTGGTIGAVAGAAAGAASVLSGAEIGAVTGMLAGPMGAAIGTIAGAIIGGLIGGTAGGATGVKLGEFIDDNILDNYHCIACNYSFSNKSANQRTGYPDDDRYRESSRHDHQPAHQQDHPHGFGFDDGSDPSDPNHDEESELT